MTKYTNIDPDRLVELLNEGAKLGEHGGGRHVSRVLKVSPQTVQDWMDRFKIKAEPMKYYIANAEPERESA